MGKQLWEMIQEEFRKEMKLRRDCRRVAAAEHEERMKWLRKMGAPAVGYAHTLIEHYASLPLLKPSDHKKAIVQAIRNGLPVPDGVRAVYEL